MNIAKLFDCNSDNKILHEVKSSDTSRSKSMKDVMANVRGLSASLIALNVRPGDKILILMTSRSEMIESLLAAFNIGAVAVPLNPQSGADNIGYVIRSIQPTICIFDYALKAEHRDALRQSCKGYIATDQSYCNGIPRCYTYSALVERQDAESLFLDQPASHPALILYTSGSSGVPKAIHRSHGVMTGFLNYFVRYYEKEDSLHSTKRPHILTLPLSHMGGLLICLNALLANRPLYMMPYFQPSLYLQLVAKHKLDSLMLIPTMYSLLIKDDPSLADLNFDSVKYCYIGAEACPESLLDKIMKKFNALPLSTYGATECLAGIGYSIEERQSGKLVKGSCGRHIYGEVKLVDKARSEHPELGELWVKNDTVEPCYLDETLNKLKFSEGWYRTGDYFYKDSDGYYYWKGRVDDMFVCKGNNVYPIELEKILLNCPSVEAACVSPIKDTSDNTIVAVLGVMRDDMTEMDLLRYLFNNGPSYAAPQFVLFTDKLPDVGIGKIDRRAASAMLQHAYLESKRLSERTIVASG